MKNKLQLPKLPTRRLATRRGVMRRLHANLFKKRATTTADPAALDSDVPNMGVGRALLVILLLHIVAVAGYIIHKKYFDHANGEAISADNTSPQKNTPNEPNKKGIASLNALPPISSNDKTDIVIAGDNYATIAAKYRVTEQEMRDYNQNVALFTGLKYRVPPKTIQALESPELRALRNGTTASAKAILVKPNINRDTVPKATIVEEDGLQMTTSARELESHPNSAKGKSYTSKKGDTFYSIARKHGITVKALLSVNGIKNDKSLRSGQTLKIPQ